MIQPLITPISGEKKKHPTTTTNWQCKIVIFHHIPHEFYYEINKENKTMGHV